MGVDTSPTFILLQQVSQKVFNMSRKQTGRIGLSMAINYFTIKGYTISLPINDTQWYDFVIEKDGIFQTVQCKATGSSDNVISLRSTGGTKGSTYDFVLDHNLDFLFCLDKDQNMFVIPVQDMKEYGMKKQITLRTEKSTNGQGFQTYKYKVSI